MDMKVIRMLTLLCLVFNTGFLFAQGLRFIGMEDCIEQRTSYEVFSSRVPLFRNVLRIEFSLAVYPPSDFGYILRVKNNENNRVFNLLYQGRAWDNTYPLRLNEEGKSSIIKADIPHDYIKMGQWMDVVVEFDLIADNVTLKVDDFQYTAKIEPLTEKWRPIINFGKSDYFIDVPSIAIKNLKVSDNRRTYLFPMNETEGSVVHEANRYIRGTAVNPEWLLEKSYKWTLVKEFSSNSVAGANYDHIRKSVIYFNRDSVYSYDVSRRESRAVRTSGQCPMEIYLGSSFVDSRDSLIYMYEAYNESNDHSRPTVVTYSPETRKWQVKSTDGLPIRFHHHSSYFDAKRNKFVFFGGFGSMIYNGHFYSYDLDHDIWHKEALPQGDTIYPRYFASMGLSESEDAVYVFGGMGNESGEQIVGRHYFYDLHRLDLKTGVITSLWGPGLGWKGENMVPVRNMIISGDGFYTVCYPEFLTNSYLQLYYFNIKDASYRKLCSKVPIRSDKMATNANIYLDRELSQLVLTVMESEDDIRSHLKIYTLSFPPLSDDEYAEMSKRPFVWMSLSAVFFVIAGIVIVVVYNRRKRRRQKMESFAGGLRNIRSHQEEQRPNSICLFGDFSALGPDGNRIQFSSQQKKLVCLIIKYSMDRGVSSKRMSQIMWPDKPDDKVKNSRGVAINHLRKLLENFEDVSLVSESGHFRLDAGEKFYCDWFDFRRQTESESPDIDRLLTIVSRGRFMSFSDDPIFDSFKEKTESFIISIFSPELLRCYEKRDYYGAVEIADAILGTDPLNEQALALMLNSMVKLKKSEDALVRYSAFVSEYASVYGTEYGKDFDSLII